MGFFKSFFRLFSKNIVPTGELDNYLVYLFPLPRGKVKVNAKIEIQPNFNVVVVVGGRMRDVLSQGKHRVNGSTMPVTFKTLKLGKPSKRGNYRNNFKAQIYYVNLKRFLNFTYTSNDPFYIRSDKFGRVKGYGEGICHVTITDSEALMSYLLRTTSKLKHNFVKNKLSYLIGNVINNVLEKNKVDFLDILLKPNKINDFLNSKVNEKLVEYGIMLENIQLNSLKLNKKMQKKVNAFLSNSAIYGLDDSDGVSVFDENENKEDSFADFSPTQVELSRVAGNEGVSQGASSYNNSENVNGGHLSSQRNEQPDYEERVFEQKVRQQEFNASANKASSPQNESEVEELNPIFKRRMGGQQVNIESGFKINNKTFNNPSLNTQEVLGEGNTLKQCKYCGKTIETHYKFCPVCGFKQ